MDLLNTVNYQLQVNLFGKGFLRYQRLKAERKALVPGNWKHPHLTAPVPSAPWLKELISRHFLEGRYANLHRKVAWVTSGAPAEILKALGFYTLYPENHGAVCGVQRQCESLSTEAEHQGYSRDLCSYARTDIGAMLSGKTPVGRLPRPDLLLCCTNICQTVLYWYQVLAHHFKCPLVVIDTPFIYTEAPEHALRYIKSQVEEAIPVIEKAAGKTLEPKALERTVGLAKEASMLWLEILLRARHRPAPIQAFDQFFFMAPIVEMRGDPQTVVYYRALLKEIDDRIAKGIGAVKNERKRVLWDNLPIWYRVRYLSDILSEKGVSVVASTYTNAWGELAPMIDPNNPLDSLAKVYIHPILNRGTGHKLAIMEKMVGDFGIDGVILHSDRSCKPYSIGQMDQRERLVNGLNIPTLLLEADHNDPRSFAEEPTANRLAAFMEMMEAA